MYRVLSYIQNYVKIKITGQRPQKFINICIRRRIAIWELTQISEKEFTMCMLASEYLKNAHSTALKAGVRVKVLKKEGLIYTLRRYKTRKALMILSVLLCGLFALMSSLVWNVSVEGADPLSVRNTRVLASELGIRKGMFMSNVNSRALAEQLLLGQKNLCWVGVKKKGTKICIEIVEGVHYEGKKGDEISEDEACDLAVSKDCLLQKVTVEQGKQIIDTGNTALKGQVVVMGEGKHAKAQIMGIVWYKAEVPVEKEVETLKYTGKEQTVKSLLIFDFKIEPPEWKWLPWNWGDEAFKSYDSVYTEKYFGKKVKMPFGTSKLVKRETVWETVTLSEEEAVYRAALKAQGALDASIPDDGQVLNTKSSVFERSGKQYYCITAEVLEDVGITVFSENN